MNGYTGDQVFNGTWGEIWFDGEYMAEVTKFRLTVNINYEEVKRARNLISDHKMTGLEVEGEVSFRKVNSTVMQKVNDALRAGKAPVFDIISNIDDPAAIGNERVMAKRAKLENLNLADWEVGSLAEENYSFKAGDWDIMDAA